MYKSLTDEYSDKFDKIIDKEDSNMETMYKKFEDLHNKVKFQAFGKVTLNTTHKQMVEEKENETEEEKKERIWKEQERLAEEEVQEIKKKPGKLGQIWEMRKRIVGSKKDTMQATAIINPQTKKIEVSRNKIKSISL